MFNFSRLSWFYRIARKELRETLRDRRTVLTLLLMPLLLYPVLALVMQRLVLSTAGSKKTAQYIIGVTDTRYSQALLDAIATGRQLLASGQTDAVRIEHPAATPLEPNNAVEALANSETAQKIEQAQFEVVLIEESVDMALENYAIDVGLVVSQDLPATPNDAGSETVSIYMPLRYEATYRPGDATSENATIELRKIFNALNQSIDRRAREVANWPALPAVQMVARPAEGDANQEFGLAGIIPLILILMTITGAVYPAIDLTAGERERGTLEALVAAPISRFNILASKYVAVVTVSVLTAMINLLAMTATLKLTGVGSILLGASGATLRKLLLTLPLLVLFSAFFSSILLALCSFARSFKEAQAYLIPVMLLSLGPGIVSIMPSVKLTTNIAVLPLINLILLTRQSLSESVPLIPAVITVVTTAFYTMAALVIAANGFGNQASVVGDDFRWSDFLKRPSKITSLPTNSQLVAYMGMFFPTYFVCTNLLANLSGDDIATNAIRNAIITLVLFLALPLLFATYQKLNLTATFRLRFWSRPLITLIIVMLFVSSLWILALEVFNLSKWLGLQTLSDEQIDTYKAIQEKFTALPWWFVVTTMAIVPAIAEEFFFRGFVLSALRRRQHIWRAILGSAVIFGLFHVINGSVLTLERFLPTTLLGFFLGWVCIKTGSLYPGILLHAGHNALMFSLPYLENVFRRFGLDKIENGLPPSWIATAVVIVCIASTLLAIGRVPKLPEDESS